MCGKQLKFTLNVNRNEEFNIGLPWIFWWPQVVFLFFVSHGNLVASRLFQH
jgi:hypothetical protein